MEILRLFGPFRFIIELDRLCVSFNYDHEECALTRNLGECPVRKEEERESHSSEVLGANGLSGAAPYEFRVAVTKVRNVKL